MQSIDFYLGKFKRPGYNCLDFATEVWLDATGEDLHERLQGLYVPRQDRHIHSSHLRAFERFASPVEPCLVLMHRRRVEPHLGVYLRQKVLHLGPYGVEFLPLDVASRGFPILEFFK